MEKDDRASSTSTLVGVKRTVVGDGDRRDEGDGHDESGPVPQVSAMKWPDSCHYAGVLIVSDDEEDEESSDDGEMA